jgi:hypothetical protein
MLQDAMDAIESIDGADMRKVFRFEFIGEPALDAGGVARYVYIYMYIFIYIYIYKICVYICIYIYVYV